MTTEITTSVYDKLANKLDFVNKQIAEIRNLRNVEVKTNGKFKYNPHANWEERIFHIDDISKLIEISSFLISKQTGYVNATKVLELNQYPEFKWMGYTVEEWVHDIKLRIEDISNSEKFHKLVSYKKQLEEYQSKEMKAAILLKEIEDNI